VNSGHAGVRDTSFNEKVPVYDGTNRAGRMYVDIGKGIYAVHPVNPIEGDSSLVSS
jgi:hypothetical protein